MQICMKKNIFYPRINFEFSRKQSCNHEDCFSKRGTNLFVYHGELHANKYQSVDTKKCITWELIHVSLHYSVWMARSKASDTWLAKRLSTYDARHVVQAVIYTQLLLAPR